MIFEGFADLDYSGPLSILSADYLFKASLLTPTASTTSLFSENVQFGATTSRLSRVNSTGSNFPIAKRVQLAPTSRTRPLPARSISESQITDLAPNLYPCHLCHRRPTTVQDLPAYANCENCQLRTCFICMRTCEGPRCQQQASFHETSTSNTLDTTRGRNICGKCCVEVGVEGRVWCLVCYEDDAEEEDHSLGPTKKEMQSERVDRVADWLQDCGEDDGQ